ncbi:MAG TPA: TonB-dependent receptor [Terriglobales bacterium]|nr:TonB-dependent receptor [Terriglobales bacterium]
MNQIGRYIALVLISTTACVCPAQNIAEVAGTVEDQSGAVIPSSKVTLTSRMTQRSLHTLTDEEGRFLFRNVEAGPYSIKATGEGLQSPDLAVIVRNTSVELKITARITTGEQITVSSSAIDRVSPEGNASAVTVNDNFLRALPTDSQNLLPLLNNFIVPAATATAGPSIVVDGLEADQLDDVPAYAIKRMIIDRNPYSAEYRRPGTARVEITTKTGSQKLFHGNLALFGRNSIFDSRNALARIKPDLNRRLWEASFSGPFAVRHSSFFVSGQHFGDQETAVVNARTLAGPIVANVPTSQKWTTLLGRVDFYSNPGRTLSFLYGFNDKHEMNHGIGGLSLPSQGIATRLRSNRIQATYQQALSPNFLNTVRFMARKEMDQSGSPPDAAKIVVNGAFIGGSAQTATLAHENILQVEDVAAYSHGRHTFRFGATDWTRMVHGSDWSNFGGTFQFADLNHFAQGLPYVFIINQGEPQLSFRVQIVSGFLQDEIKLRPNLNVALGLRYDWQSNLDRRSEFAPRISVAYAPGDQKTVFRAGAGIFYEYLPQIAVWRTALFEGLRQSQLVIPNPSFHGLPVSGTAPPSIFRLAPDLTAPYVLQSSLGIERQLGKQMVLTVEGHFLRGVHLFRTLDINAPLPQTGVRPMANFLNLDQIESTAMMRSAGLSVSFRGRVGRRAYLMAQYNLSHTTNDTSGIFSLPANNYDLRAERGRADFDRRHRFSLTGVVNLPGSTRVGTVLALSSGAPFDITTGFDTNGDTVANDRPWGITRNQGQGTGTVQLDLRFTKLFRVPRALSREGHADNCELNADFFNAINHANFSNFIGVQSSPFFGLPSTALPGRTVQLSVRYRF